MSQYILVAYLIGFTFAVGYEWTIGPYSNEQSAIPGWLASVLWPITLTVRIGNRVGLR